MGKIQPGGKTSRACHFPMLLKAAFCFTATGPYLYVAFRTLASCCVSPEMLQQESGEVAGLWCLLFVFSAWLLVFAALLLVLRGALLQGLPLLGENLLWERCRASTLPGSQDMDRSWPPRSSPSRGRTVARRFAPWPFRASNSAKLGERGAGYGAEAGRSRAAGDPQNWPPKQIGADGMDSHPDPSVGPFQRDACNALRPLDTRAPGSRQLRPTHALSVDFVAARRYARIMLRTWSFCLAPCAMCGSIHKRLMCGPWEELYTGTSWPNMHKTTNSSHNLCRKLSSCQPSPVESLRVRHLRRTHGTKDFSSEAQRSRSHHLPRHLTVIVVVALSLLHFVPRAPSERPLALTQHCQRSESACQLPHTVLRHHASNQSAVILPEVLCSPACTLGAFRVGLGSSRAPSTYPSCHPQLRRLHGAQLVRCPTADAWEDRKMESMGLALPRASRPQQRYFQTITTPKLFGITPIALHICAKDLEAFAQAAASAGGVRWMWRLRRRRIVRSATSRPMCTSLSAARGRRSPLQLLLARRSCRSAPERWTRRAKCFCPHEACRDVSVQIYAGADVQPQLACPMSLVVCVEPRTQIKTPQPTMLCRCLAPIALGVLCDHCFTGVGPSLVFARDFTIRPKTPPEHALRGMH